MTRAEDKSFFRAGLVIFLAAWTVRLAVAWITHRFTDLSRFDMERIAVALATTGAYSSLIVPGLPTAGESPGYVIIMAAIFKLFGTGLTGEAVKVCMATAASSVRCALSAWLVARMNLGKTAVILTALFSILWIGGLDTETSGDWDPPYTGAFLVALTGLHYFKALNTFGYGRTVFVGLLWGLCASFNFSVLAILAGFVAVEFWNWGRRSMGNFGVRVVCISLGVSLVLLPWGIRNRITLGKWLFTRNLLGYGMHISFHDGASWAEPINNHPTTALPGHPDDLSKSPYPHLNPALRPEVVALGEVEWDRMLMRRGTAWVKAHPSEALVLFAQHTWYFWFPPGPDFYWWQSRKAMWPYSIAKWMLTLLAIAGLWRLWRRDVRAAQLLTAILALFPLVYYLVNWSSRYRAPIEWVLVVLAAIAVSGLWEKHGAHQPPGR